MYITGKQGGCVGMGCVIFLILAAFVGCSGPQAKPGEAPRPARGSGEQSEPSAQEGGVWENIEAFPSVVLSPDTPETAWESVWEHTGTEKGVPADEFVMNSMTAQATDTGYTFQLSDKDSSAVLVLKEKAIVASQCSRIRVRAYGVSQGAGLWWAREDDIKSDGYPFGLDRFVPLKAENDGVWEAYLSDQPSWNGEVRLLRLDLYGSAGDTAQVNKFEVLADTSQGGSALKEASLISPERVSYAGEFEKAMTLLTRAVVTRTAEDIAAASVRADSVLEKLYESGAPGVAPTLLDLGVLFVQNDETAVGLRAFAVAGLRSGDAPACLEALKQKLTEEEQTKLWPDGPALNLLYNGDMELWDMANTAPVQFVPPATKKAYSFIRQEDKEVASGKYAMRQTWQASDGGESYFRLLRTWVTGMMPRTTYRVSVKAKNLSKDTYWLLAHEYPGGIPDTDLPTSQLLGKVNVTVTQDFKQFAFEFTTGEPKEFAVRFSFKYANGPEFPVECIWDDLRLEQIVSK